MRDIESVLPYGAFALGSAVYFGGWLRDARRFLDDNREILAARPTWLFSSGPIEAPDAAGSEVFDSAELVQRSSGTWSPALRRQVGPQQSRLPRPCNHWSPSGARR